MSVAVAVNILDFIENALNIQIILSNNYIQANLESIYAQNIKYNFIALFYLIIIISKLNQNFLLFSN